MITTAAELRDSGMQSAIHHADHVIDDWSVQAFDYLQRFVRDRGGEFMCEDIRAFASENGLPQPPTNRAWGSLMIRAARQGLIKQSGFGKTKGASAHRTPAAVWVVA